MLGIENLDGWKRTHSCGELRLADVGKVAVLAGWVHRVRDHGGVFFLDLRDRGGVTQVVCRPGEGGDELLGKARSLRGEFVVAVRGKVGSRPGDMRNPGMPTGEIEVEASAMKILNTSEVPPFVIGDEVTAGEDLRLEYRYLDLRSAPLQRTLGLRHKIAFETRRYLDGRGFWEVETPMLVRPTPEGARDYLVPSRIHPGCFYALPQSPQLYKQILMVSGMDRYFQIARCLRDEDLRADRQPEHTQIDIEMSFVEEDEVYELVEGLMSHVFETCLGVSVRGPFQRLSYEDAMDLYGTDKPDLRYGMELVDLTEAARGCDYRVFRDAIESGGLVKGLVIPGGGGMSRREQDELEAEAKLYGARGLGRTRIAAAGFDSGFAKFLDAGTVERIRSAMNAAEGDLLVVVADQRAVANRSLGAIRSKIGNQRMDPQTRTRWQFLWVCRFPLFERDPETGAIAPAHHMFTMPLEEDLPHLATDPLAVHARLYDLVLNGVELASGSIRIHRRDIQEQVMSVIGIDPAEADRRFGFLLRAFQFGAPPHGGIAIGLDRVVMLAAGRSSLRDTIAFPKTTSASSLMDGAPGPVDPKDLKGLHIRMEDESPQQGKGPSSS